jgi:hypothetical protein
MPVAIDGESIDRISCAPLYPETEAHAKKCISQLHRKFHVQVDIPQHENALRLTVQSTQRAS